MLPDPERAGGRRPPTAGSAAANTLTWEASMAPKTTSQPPSADAELAVTAATRLSPMPSAAFEYCSPTAAATAPRRAGAAPGRSARSTPFTRQVSQVQSLSRPP